MKTAECISWLWRISRGWRGYILLDTLCGCVRAASMLSFIWLSKYIIDIATGNATGRFRVLVPIMAGCMLVQLILGAVRARIETRTEIRLRSELRYRLFTHLMESRWTGRDSFHTGDVMNRLEEDVAAVTGLVCISVPSSIVTCIQLAGAFYLLANLDIRLALIVAALMPAAILLSKGFVRRMRRLTREIRVSDSKVQSHLQENLQHRTLISALEYTSKTADELMNLQTDLQNKVMDRTDYSLFSRFLVQAGFAAGYLAVMLWGIYGLRNGSISFGVMAAFLQLVSQIQRPIVDLSRQVPGFARVLTSIERLCELTDIPLEEQGAPVRFEGTPGVRFENVTFSYPDADAPVLDGFSCDFRPGSMTAVVGETGVGKSTMTRLILALLLPESGEITIYDRNSSVQASPMTRCNIVYIPQGNTLISGTVRDNLLLGNPDAREEELQEALHTAAADFVFSLPQGLDTVCGEQGAGLSEGQAQRIAIARGLLRPGGIMLLDEPTSSLDSETELLMLQRLGKVAAERTVIIITHREAVCELCGNTVRLVR
ncbi:MAG: ABC transporter ATP-binding protein [Bacteroidales bacterium]|nr:ABC transporter ATP-binding protein [Bacteroidales bacterium]